VAGLIYLDASAIVKLVVEERESPALRDARRHRPRHVSSALALVEASSSRRRERSPGLRTDASVGRLAPRSG